MSLNTAVVDQLFQQRFEEKLTPGLAYGVVRGSELVHSGAFGATTEGGPAPTAESSFRIASMSKSFTAAAVLLLRDRGQLDLPRLAVPNRRADADDRPPRRGGLVGRCLAGHEPDPPAERSRPRPGPVTPTSEERSAPPHWSAPRIPRPAWERSTDASRPDAAR